jgi:hypothetical protein
MLVSIRKSPRETPTDEPADLLLACHARLRHFSATAVALATRSDLDEKQIDDASNELVRYFRVALPLHEADEEVTLAPHLEPLVEAAAALETMHRQHVAIHAKLDVLLPLWEARKRHESTAAAHELASLLDDHLALEESRIFPCIAKLPAPTRKHLFEEMRSRRTL